MDNIFIFRGFERILIVFLSGLLIYLGYKLFALLPDKIDSSGKVVLPGNVSIYMSRIGPGAFFALFGMVVLIYSVTTQVDFYDEQGRKRVSQMQPEIDFRNQKHFASQFDMNSLEMQISSLNQLNECITEALNGSDGCLSNYEMLALVNNNLEDIKMSLILFNWKEDWGKQERFVQWVESDQKENYPKELSLPISIFNE